MKIRLRDMNETVVVGWQRHFQNHPEVEISQGEIFDRQACAIISPANSFGFMDGGIDLAYSERFGWGLQEELQSKIRKDHYGELPVGQATIVPTGNTEIPFLISAPTMRIPGDVSKSLNAYLAFRASLAAVREFNKVVGGPRISSILSPGLCTAVGRMTGENCGRQMAHAYMSVVKQPVFAPVSLGMALDEHYRLIP